MKRGIPAIDMSCGGHAPILGALFHEPGAIARHDAVAWGYGRGADRRGVEIHQQTEVTGIRLQGGRVVGVDTTRGSIATSRVLCAVAGFTPRMLDMVDLHTPIYVHPLQAMVSEPVKPWLDPIIVSGSLHVYVSQTARGELVMGASLDPYELHHTRSTLDFVEGLSAHMLDMFPFLSEVKVNRQWAGLADMTPDFAPIMGVDAGGGFLPRRRLGHLGIQGDAGVRQDHEPHRRDGAQPSVDRRLHDRSLRALPADRRKGRGVGGSLMKIMVCPLERAAPGVANSRTAARCATARIRTPAATPSGAATCSIGPARRASSTSGGATSPRASGSSRCATPRAMWSSRPIPAEAVRQGLADRARRGRRAVMHRLEPHPPENGSIARRCCSFTFEGQRLPGLCGRHHFLGARRRGACRTSARSFKYHRPRSILSFANHDSNTLFQVDGVPNVRGDVTLLREGMRVAAVNTFGGLAHDKARILDRFARWLPVGFYYKAFHSKRLFPRWERMFRALTGLGRGGARAPRARPTPKRYGFCDVLVIGGGPERPRGRARSGGRGRARGAGRRSVSLAAARGDGCESVRALVRRRAMIRRASPCLRATVAAGYYADHWVALAEPTRMTKMRAKAVVFATGVIEQPAVFRNNDLPGVMLASGASRLLRALSASLPGGAS